ncbi:MAG: hypothetical protein U0326_02995 [Polyangiales bacterium]
MSEIIRPVVTLPRMNAADAITLALSLKTALNLAQSAQAKAAEEHATKSQPRKADASNAPALVLVMPGNIPACMARLDACCVTLTRARREGAATQAEERPRRGVRKAAFDRYKKSWSALLSQVAIWRETGALASLTAAQRAALDEVFPEGGNAKDLTGTARRVWLDGRDLLSRIKARGLGEVFTALGAEAVQAHVQRLHAELAAELGVTAPTKSAAATGEVGDAFVALHGVMREYVVKVHAMIDPAMPESAALVDALLAPFSELRATGRTTATKPAKKIPAKPPVIDTDAKPANSDTAKPALRPTGTG